jgi:hypothetical protein
MVTIIKTITITLKNSTGTITLKDITGWEHSLLDELVYFYRNKTTVELPVYDIKTILDIGSEMNSEHETTLPTVELAEFLINKYLEGSLLSDNETKDINEIIDMYLEGEVN